MPVTSRTSHSGLRDTILVVDGNVRSQRLVRKTLEPVGYRVVTVNTAHTLTAVIESCEPVLILLDVQLPGADGFAVCQGIRATSSIPVIFLTARGGLADKVRGFAVGADDYMTTPYDPLELIARIGAVLWRTQGVVVQRQALFQSGPLTIDFEQRRVALDGQEMVLSRTEYRLLEYLALNAGRTLVLDAILVNVWGEDYLTDSASIFTYISRLRRKLGEGSDNTHLIITKPGVGYMMPTDHA